MNEIIIYRIIIGIVTVGILWLYFNFRRIKVNQFDDRAVLEKEKEIDVLKQEKIGLENLLKETKDSLTEERTRSTEQLKTINNTY